MFQEMGRLVGICFCENRKLFFEIRKFGERVQNSVFLNTKIFG